MKSLFDKFIPPQFWPSTARDLFALRLAQKLDDASAVHHYVILADRFTEGQLLWAYRRTLRGNLNGDSGRRFQLQLERVPGNGNHEPQSKLIAIRVERRAVAAAVFQGQQLEYTDAKQLSSARDKALASSVGFIRWMLERFATESAALESIPNGHEFQRRALHEAVCGVLRDRALPIWEIPKPALLAGCGHPPLESRSQLRDLATRIWPVIAGTHSQVFIQDAAILGLHVQTERLFIIN